LERDLNRALRVLQAFSTRTSWALEPYISVVKAFIRQTASPVPLAPADETLFADLFPPDLDFDLDALFNVDAGWTWPLASRLPTPTFDA
jgi:hypothetical protein